MVISLAVVGGEPAPGARVQHCTISPAIDMDGMHKYDVATIQRERDGGWRGRRGRIKGTEGTKVVVKGRSGQLTGPGARLLCIQRCQGWCHPVLGVRLCRVT